MGSATAPGTAADPHLALAGESPAPSTQHPQIHPHSILVLPYGAARIRGLSSFLGNETQREAAHTFPPKTSLKSEFQVLRNPKGAGERLSPSSPFPAPVLLCPWKTLGGGWQKLCVDNQNETNMCTQLFSLTGVRVVLPEG